MFDENRYWAHVRSAALLLSCTAVACSSPTATEASRIGAAGGSLAFTEGPAAGLRIDIPAGALQDATDVRVEVIEPTNLPERTVAVGPAIRILPAGLELARAAEVSIPFQAMPDALLTRAGTSSAWTSIEGAHWDAGRSALVAPITHFAELVAVSDGPVDRDDSGPVDRDDSGPVDRDDSGPAVSDGGVPSMEICDVFADPECPEGQQCRPWTTLQTEGWCLPVAEHPIARGGACGPGTAPFDDCGPGLHCNGVADGSGGDYPAGFCMPYCNESTPCGAGEYCASDTGGIAWGVCRAEE